jgi:hypothetical protein
MSFFPKHNFELSKKKRYSKLLANHYVIEIEPERGGWAGSGEIVFRLKSKKFNLFMSKIFKDCNASHYCRQTYVDLTHALMGIGINLVEDRKNLTLLTANGVLRVEEVISQLGSVQRTSELYNFLYHHSTNKIMALIEGIWVQIFLMFDMGISVEKIFEQLQHLPPDVAGPDVDIDLGALQLFEQAYLTL